MEEVVKKLVIYDFFFLSIPFCTTCTSLRERRVKLGGEQKYSLVSKRVGNPNTDPFAIRNVIRRRVCGKGLNKGEVKLLTCLRSQVA